MVSRLMLVLALVLPAAAFAGQAPARPLGDGVATLVSRLDAALTAGNRDAILALATPGRDRASIEEFSLLLTSPPAARVVINERDRAPLDGEAMRVLVEIFTERDDEARLGTWRLDARPGPSGDDPWTIDAVSRLSVISGLYRLSIDGAKQYDIRDLTVKGPDLLLHMASGTAFVARTPDGPTAVVLLGKGQIRFTPADPAERTQIRIFSGEDTFVQEFDGAFIRVNPSEFPLRFDTASLQPRQPSPSDVRRATEIFDDYVGRTLQLDLSDLSRDRWSLVPPFGDLIAEVRTRRHGSLTYARSSNEAEDVSFFDRRRRKNISVYASEEKLARRGRFYSEDDLVDYDVLAYDLEVDIAPERSMLSGVARVKVRIETGGVTSLTLRLAESLGVRGVYSPQFGRLLHLRVIGQNSLIINTPSPLVGGTEMWLEIRYGGRLPSQSFDREAIRLGQDLQDPYVPTEQRYLYSNRTYWYPQATVTDYATAKLRIIVPGDYDVVATGDPTGPPAPPPGVVEGSKARKMFVFDAAKPARYLACVVSRFSPVESTTLELKKGDSGEDVALYVQANPRQVVRVRDMLEKAGAIFEFYASLAGDAPYPSFTIALTESDRPGGHSPPYFAVLNQVVMGSTFVWRNDPVSFDNYPTFFLAHEVAHQWWGHAVGWKNYHEQWLSEGFAQYFAAMYAEKERAGSVLGNLLRQMRHTAIRASDQGPVYLGYRLGHIQGDDKVFRAVVYNKGAMVLHMLRRIVGDERFFAGLRAFYAEWKFKKAGTDDFRVAMERASGRDLTRFFETWIYGSEIPRIKFDYHLDEGAATLRFEQRGNPVDVPITVTVTYTSGESDETVVVLSEKTTDRRIPLRAAVRTIVANADNAALVEIEK
jgi:hypothetical protein